MGERPRTYEPAKVTMTSDLASKLPLRKIRLAHSLYFVLPKVTTLVQPVLIINKDIVQLYCEVGANATIHYHSQITLE